MTYHETMLDALDTGKTPSSLAYLICADAYEEAGMQDEADCLRWMEANGIHTHLWGATYDWWSVERWCALAGRSSLGNFYVPDELIVRLPQEERKDRHSWAGFATFKKAMLALFAAWKLAKAEGWRPQNEGVTA